MVTKSSDVTFIIFASCRSPNFIVCGDQNFPFLMVDQSFQQMLVPLIVISL